MSFAELDWIYFLHQFRTPLLDEFFKALNFFDRSEFFFILIPTVWLGYHWKAGFKLFYLFVISNLINHALKEFFAYPRPFHFDAELGIIQVKGYGFPSGAAQSVILLSGLLLIYWKSHWKWLVALSYAFLISLSRLYLGVHFPSDIVGGWIVGGLLLILFLFLHPRLEGRLETLSLPALFAISQLIPLLLLILEYSLPAIRVCSTAMGMGLGLCIVHRHHLFISAPKDYREMTIRAIIGVLGTFACYELTSLLLFSSSTVYLFMQFFLLGLWTSLGANLVLRMIFPSRAISIEKA
jgi:membrane-associated phospholipid phosphatase